MWFRHSYIQTNYGKVNMLMHEYAYYGVIQFTLLVKLSGSTIHVMTNLIMLVVNKSSLF